MAIPDIAITRGATTTIMAVIHIRVTERLIIVGGRITTEAIELTSIISIVTTATRRRVGKVKWLAWSNSKPAFFCLKPNHSA